MLDSKWMPWAIIGLWVWGGSFTNDLGADSLDTVELIMEFEKEFNIAIPDEQAEKIGTVGEAIEYIKKNIK